MMNDFAKVLAGSRWLMDARNFRAMVERCVTATPDAIQAAAAAFASRPQTPTMIGDIAVINCCGPITYRNSFFSMWYGSSTIEGMQQQFRTALLDPAVRAIVFRTDTPGGSSEMIAEFADEIYGARGQKPIYAVADTMMCSAGFWLFSQVDTIYAPGSSGCVGSVGAYLAHESIAGLLEQMGIKVTLISYGENKVLGNPYEELSEAAEAQFQLEVNEVGVQFDTAAARGRGVTRAIVKDTFGQGLVFSGTKAKKLGMIDHVGTFDQVLAKLTGSGKRKSVQAQAPASTIITGTDGFGNVTVISGQIEENGVLRDLTTAEIAGMNATTTTGVSAKDVKPCETCGRSSTCSCPGGCTPGCETCTDGCPCKDDTDETEASAKAAAERDAINIAIALGE